MPSPSISRPARFRQTRVLIVGCGDVGLRVARELLPRCRVLALTSQPERAQALRQAGLVPLLGNLDQPETLARLAGLATRVVHLAPPPGQGSQDTRTRHLLQALSRRGRVRNLVYGSTTGVYGNAGGARFNETRPVAPTTPRAQRRVHAEALVRWWGRRAGVRASILRIPGIYAVDREGGHPRDRVLKGSPVLRREDDVFTNHIQADDLARACVAALWRGRPGRVVHASDDQTLLMGDYFDMVADLCGLPRPPRMSRAEATLALSPMQMSFLSESRRLDNHRLHAELRVTLRCPTVREGLGLA
ncbi:SDR family oxidoreductase [Aquabacterium sp.]|uniref:SDR family oxidoreductase n=1 Tax=Aquabacterium sp. TaxID=1872578 RepID=UPI002489584B|nr:SDR family oxidoreductase [Aquabacterium sp.]MDI1259727.1 SDR family oxidoreductase [Aquabacterium sp.]